FLMAAHSESHTFQQERSWFLADRIGNFAYRPDHVQHIIPIHLESIHSIADSFVDELLAAELLIAWRGESPAVIFNGEDHGKFPNRRYVQCFVEISFGCTSVTAENDRCLVVPFQFVCQGNPVCDP